MTTPLAELRVSVNGGAVTFGNVEVPSGATLQFSATSTVAWTQQRWEIYDYPEGWATPSGWTLDGTSGLIYSTALVPALITLPANTSKWGAWMPRLRINEQLNDDLNVLPGLQDTATKITMLSPKGQIDVGALEGDQACTTPTKIKQWVRSYQRNLRVVEGGLGVGGGGAPGGADGDVQAKSGASFVGDTNVKVLSGFLTVASDLKFTNSAKALRLSVGTLSADATLTLPDATDTLVGKATSDVLTNKTFNVAGTGNALTATSGVAGDLLVHDGAKYVRFPKGTALQNVRVKSDGSTLEFYTPSGVVGVTTVANLTALTALATTALTDGAFAYVQTLRSFFYLDKTNSPTADGITIVNGASSTKWLRTAEANPEWAAVGTWYIDPVAGNDENLGDVANPLKHVAELKRRWGRNRLLGASSAISVHVLSAPGQTDPIPSNWLNTTPDLTITFYGVRTTSRTGTLTGVTALVQGVSETQIVDSGASWASDVGKVVRLTSGANTGARAMVGKDLGSHTARTSPFALLPVPGGVNPTLVDPATTNTYSVETLTAVFIEEVQGVGGNGAGYPSINFFDLDIQNLGFDTLIPILPSAYVTFVGCAWRAQPAPMACQQVYFIGSYLENGVFAQNGTYAIFNAACVAGGAEIMSTSGSFLVFDFDTIVQGGGIVCSAGDVQIGTCGIFDATIFDRNPRGAGVSVGGTPLGRGGAIVATFNAGASGLYGSGHAGPGVAVDAGGEFVCDQVPTITGTGGNFQLSGATTAHAWNEAAGRYLPAAITCGWGQLSSALSGSGFGGAAHNVQTGASISLSSGFDAGVAPYVVTAVDHTWAIGEETVEFSVTGKTLTLPASPYTNQEINMVAPTSGTSTADGNGKNINGSATYTSAVNGESTVLRYNGTQWRIV